MIFEKLPLQFDVAKLCAHLRRHVLHLPAQMESEFFGGWSVLSSDGKFSDGWKPGALAFEPTFMPGASLDEKMSAIGVKRSAAYIHPTEICEGYMRQVIDTIRDSGLHPMRARISMLKSGGQSSVHRDAPEGEYAVRLHIPLMTNEECTFNCEEGSAHLPADGSTYLLRVNRVHQVVNFGDSDRYHLIMSVRDTKALSQFHRFPTAN